MPQMNPKYNTILAHVVQADSTLVNAVISCEELATAKKEWEAKPWQDRFQVFNHAADLLRPDGDPNYRHPLVAAIVCGQGKSVQQADRDVTEVCVRNPN